MKTVSGIFLLLALFLVFLGCGKRERDINIAIAGKETLSGKSFKAMLPEGIEFSSSDEAYRTVEVWTDEAILAQAAKDLKLDRKPEIEQRILDSKRMILASALEQEFIMPRIRVDTTEVLAYYQENINEFLRTEDEVRCAHIIVSDSTIADTISALLKSIPFEELVAQFSEDINRGDGGDIGFLTKNQMHPLLAQAAFSMGKGDVAGPIRTEFGYHFLKQLDFAPKGTLKDFSLVESEIRDILFGEKFREVYEAVLDSLKKEKSVFIDSVAIDRLLRSNEKKY